MVRDCGWRGRSLSQLFGFKGGPTWSSQWGRKSWGGLWCKISRWGWLHSWGLGRWLWADQQGQLHLCYFSHAESQGADQGGSGQGLAGYYDFGGGSPPLPRRASNRQSRRGAKGPGMVRCQGGARWHPWHTSESEDSSTPTKWNFLNLTTCRLPWEPSNRWTPSNVSWWPLT